MNAIFYSLALGGSDLAPKQLVQSLRSLRAFDREIAVYVFLFGGAPEGFVATLQALRAQVRHLGDYGDYVARKHSEHAALFALDPKIHRWLVLEEPELKACSRLLYIDSDTLFLAPGSVLFDRYRDADFYAREEPFSRRSSIGHDPSYLDEEQLDALRAQDGVGPVLPFNTGACLMAREVADGITGILPAYFDNLFRFLSWFRLHPLAGAEPGNTSTRAVHDPRFRPDASRAMPYPAKSRWIVDQVAMWLALGRLPQFRYADFSAVDVWQGAEFYNKPPQPLPLLCHYFSSNTTYFFDWVRTLPPSALQR